MLRRPHTKPVKLGANHTPSLTTKLRRLPVLSVTCISKVHIISENRSNIAQGVVYEDLVCDFSGKGLKRNDFVFRSLRIDNDERILVRINVADYQKVREILLE